MTKRVIEIEHRGAIEGLVEIRDNGLTEISVEWLKRLIESSGRTWEEYTA